MSMIGVLALLVLAPAAASMPAARTRPQLLVVVRQEARTPLTGDLLRRIGAEAREIWQPYLDIAFQPADSLTPLRGDSTLELILTDRESNGGTSGLGWIDFVDGEPSRTITVSITAAKALAAAGKWSGRPVAAWPPAVGQLFLVRAVARGVAHELGHYLLHSKAHSDRGLMRARFTVDEIMTNGLGQYRLQPSEVSLLEERFVSDALVRRIEELGIRN